MLQFPAKAPSDRLDTNAFDFSLDLAPGETVAASPAPSLSATGGVNVSVANVTSPRVVFWVEGGEPETLCIVKCIASSSQGRGLVKVGSLYVGPPGLDDPAAVAPLS